MPEVRPRVVVVDDHPLLRRGLIGLLEGEGRLEVVGEAASVEEVAGLVHRTGPDLVLMDIRLQGTSGLTVVPALRSTCPDLRVIVLTMYDDPAFRRAARAAGAHGYVCKRDADTELLGAIRTVLSGGEHFTTPRHNDATSIVSAPSLTARERDVVRLVARGHTNRAIADHLEISIKSVESYRARVMQKLGFGSRVDLVRYALEVGLVGRGDTPDVEE